MEIATDATTRHTKLKGPTGNRDIVHLTVETTIKLHDDRIIIFSLKPDTATADNTEYYSSTRPYKVDTEETTTNLQGKDDREKVNITAGTAKSVWTHYLLLEDASTAFEAEATGKTYATIHRNVQPANQVEKRELSENAEERVSYIDIDSTNRLHDNQTTAKSNALKGTILVANKNELEEFFQIETSCSILFGTSHRKKANDRSYAYSERRTYHTFSTNRH